VVGAVRWLTHAHVRLIHDIKPAGQIVRDIVSEAEEILNHLHA